MIMMKSIFINNEAVRFKALRQYKILGNNLEVILDDHVRLIAHICGNPNCIAQFYQCNPSEGKSGGCNRSIAWGSVMPLYHPAKQCCH